MVRRITFIGICLFFVTMNVLLWRSEFSGQKQLAGSIPPQVAWEKILTAPDDSTMEIIAGGQKSGYCRWIANVGEAVTTGKRSDENEIPEGMIAKPTGYSIDLEGNYLFRDPASDSSAHDAAQNPRNLSRLRFEFHTRFTTNHVWQDFSLRTVLRPMSLEIKSRENHQKIVVKFDDGTSRIERTINYSDLGNPGKILSEFGVSGVSGWLGYMGAMSGLGRAGTNTMSFGLNWKAHNDWLRIGHSQVRVYRLETRLLDRYEVKVTVSRVGEILRIDLPGDLVLMNDALINL